MSVSLIGWGRFFDDHGNKITVPAPSTNHGAPWLWDFLANQCHALADVGFDRIQLPPASKVQGGSGAGCDGYGVYDLRDLGTKPQQGSTPTRYGDVEQLRRLVAVAHANGIAIDLDIVLHQLIGGNNGTYQYLGPDGKALNGRGAMHPGCFRGAAPRRPADSVPVPSDDFAFGDEKVYQNCNPSGYTINDALDYGEWLFRTTGADGGRIDDVKGTWPQFISQFLNHGVMSGKRFYSEYFDGNPANLNWWATSWPLNSRSGVSDFTMHFALVSACNNFNAGSLVNAGYAQWRPDLAYGFVDNPDTDTSDGEQVIECKLLAYAFLLSVATQEVLIYGKDYFPSSIWPGAYGLKPLLDNLIWINKAFAYGSTAIRWVDDKVIVINRDGNGGSIGTSPGLLTAINFDTWNNRTVTCATSFWPNTHLHDYTGRHPDIWTDENGNATFTIPANAYAGGQSYLCFSYAGVSRSPRNPGWRTTQVFEGAADLDIPPAVKNKNVVAGRIYVEGNSDIQISAEANIAATLVDDSVSPPAPVINQSQKTGWYSLVVTTNELKPTPFQLSVTYSAPQKI